MFSHLTFASVESPDTTREKNTARQDTQQFQCGSLNTFVCFTHDAFHSPAWFWFSSACILNYFVTGGVNFKGRAVLLPEVREYQRALSRNCSPAFLSPEVQTFTNMQKFAQSQRKISASANKTLIECLIRVKSASIELHFWRLNVQKLAHNIDHLSSRDARTARDDTSRDNRHANW